MLAMIQLLADSWNTFFWIPAEQTNWLVVCIHSNKHWVEEVNEVDDLLMQNLYPDFVQCCLILNTRMKVQFVPKRNNFKVVQGMIEKCKKGYTLWGPLRSKDTRDILTSEDAPDEDEANEIKKEKYKEGLKMIIRCIFQYITL